MSARTRPDSGAELEHLKRYLIERARGRCRPPQGEQDSALPEFRVPDRDRVAQGEFARSAGIHPSTLSALFVKSGANLGDSWTGFVDTLGMTIEEALAASRDWKPPEPPTEEEGSPNLKLAIEMFERSEGKVGRSVRKAMLRILAHGDRKPDEWMQAIRFARMAQSSMPQDAQGHDGEDNETPPSIPTADAGKAVHPQSPVVPIRRRQRR